MRTHFIKCICCAMFSLVAAAASGQVNKATDKKHTPMAKPAPVKHNLRSGSISTVDSQKLATKKKLLKRTLKEKKLLIKDSSKHK